MLKSLSSGFFDSVLDLDEKYFSYHSVKVIVLLSHLSQCFFGTLSNSWLLLKFDT